MTIGEKIISLRKKYNFTQEKLAEKIDISRQTLSSWEGDITSPDLKQASIIAKIFKISLDELVSNNIEFECKDNLKNNQLLSHLIDKTCYLNFDDDFFDLDLNCFDTPVKILNINDDFIKIAYQKKKKTQVKLIDMDLITSIKVIEGDDN